jgi:hypothetical protein
MNISEQLSKLTIIQSPNMKPYPYQEVNAIEREMCDLRNEVTSLRIQYENAQRCLNSLYRKRQIITLCGETVNPLVIRCLPEFFYFF